MRGMIVAAALLCKASHGQGTFVPPAASRGVVEGVNFQGEAVGARFTSRFKECDARDTCDGRPLGRFGCRNDPNNNAALLKVNNGTIFYNGKMGLDADGSPFSQRTPGLTDQPHTSLVYPLPGGPSINSDRVPFIVIPLGGFDSAMGVKIGDVAAVVHGDKRVFAVIADEGPACKIGEGSMQLHEALGHTVCRERDRNGDCVRIRDVSIEKDVLYFLFPGTHTELLPGLKPDNINARIQTIGAVAWQRLIAH